MAEEDIVFLYACLTFPDKQNMTSGRYASPQNTAHVQRAHLNCMSRIM